MDCIKTWHKLLNTFKELYTTSKKLLATWSYYDQLQFILPYIIRDDLFIMQEKYPAIKIHLEEISEMESSATKMEHNDTKFDVSMDNEDLFLLSFAPNLTRLTPKQNGLARIRILEALYNLEFEE